MKMKRCSLGVVFALSLSTILGCGGGFADPVPVSGTVTLKGNPVDGAVVSFLAGEGSTGRSASGKTNAQGEFSLTTFATNDGALPGEYIVTIAKTDAKDKTRVVDAAELGPEYVATMNAASTGQMSEFQSNVLPEEYASPATSDLKRTVADGDKNVFEFDLE